MKKFFAIMIMAMITFSAVSTADANTYRLARTVIKICIYLCTSSIAAPAGGGGQGNTNGDITFEWLGSSLDGEVPAWADLQAKNLTGGGFDPFLGSYTFRLDDSRLASSRIQAHGISEFPAHSTLRFHAVLELGSQPGIEYRSIGLIEVENPNLTSWPHNNTVYNQIGSANFDKNGDGFTAYTVSGINVSLTQQGD